ncbi:hypothetical protein ISN44_As10g028910 [Arabidopsis suecica]|uniref:Uncharacterized protein n=1 Tax=Arabidopsis suecica TaxID=45249 RepID=A0A8T2A3R7_ARASU|nr:hypothetical protein ISN44_As10g028910 [Arabidopsis suecica]
MLRSVAVDGGTRRLLAEDSPGITSEAVRQIMETLDQVDVVSDDEDPEPEDVSSDEEDDEDEEVLGNRLSWTSTMTVEEPEGVVFVPREYSSRTTHTEGGKGAVTFHCMCGRTHTCVSIGGAIKYKLQTGASIQLDREPDAIIGDSGNYEQRPNTTVKRYYERKFVENLDCNCKCGRTYQVKVLTGGHIGIK